MTYRNLDQEDLFKIIKKGLEQENMHSYIGDMQFLFVNWSMMSYNKKEKYYWVDFSKGEGKIMSYHNGYNHKYITIQQIKRYIQKQFDGCNSIILDLRINDDEKLQLSEDNNEVLKLINFTATVYYEEAILEPDQLREMIEIALAMKDRGWFEELTKKYNTYKGV